MTDPGLDAAIERFVNHLGDTRLPKNAAALRESVKASGDPEVQEAIDFYGAELFARAAKKNLRERRDFRQAVELYSAGALKEEPLPAALDELARSHKKRIRGASTEEKQRLDRHYQLTVDTISAFGLEAFTAAVEAARSGGESRPPERIGEVGAKIGGDLEDPEQLYRLGHALTKTRARDKAEKYLLAAAEKGHRLAQTELGGILIRKEDLGEREQGVKWLFRAAQFASKDGNPKAQLLLAQVYEVGVPGVVEKNHRLSGLWLRKAVVTQKDTDSGYTSDPLAATIDRAERDPFYAYLLAVRYLDGHGVERDREKGIALLDKLVRQKTPYSAWAASKLEELRAPKPFSRRGLARQPITQAYRDTVRPKIVGEPREKGLWRTFLDSTPLFDVIADFSEGADNQAYEALADFLSLVLDPTLSKEEKLERLEVKGERMHAGLSKLLRLDQENRTGFQPAFDELFRVFVERFSAQQTGEPTKLERSIASLIEADDGDRGAGIIHTFRDLGRWLDQLARSETSVETLAKRAVEGADRFLEIQSGVKAVRGLEQRSVSDVLATSLDNRDEAVAAGLVDFLSLFLDPTLPPEERALKLRERQPKIEQALASTVGGIEGGAFFTTLFTVLGKHLEQKAEPGRNEPPLLTALRSWLPFTEGRRDRANVVKELVELGRALDTQLAGAGHDPGLLPEVLDGIEGLLAAQKTLSAGLAQLESTAFRGAVKGVAAALAVPAAYEAFRINGITDVLATRSGEEPLLVELQRTVHLIPPSMARQLGEERTEAALSFLSIFCDPLMTREKKEALLDAAISGSADLLDFDGLAHANWTELTKTVAERLTETLPIKPDLRDWLVERFVTVGQRLDQGTSVTVADPVGNLGRRSVKGFLTEHREAILDFSILSPHQSVDGLSNMLEDAFGMARDVSRAGRITQEDVVGRILPGIEIGLDSPLFVALDLTHGLVPAEVREKLGDEAVKDLLTLLSLPCDPFKSRSERAELLDGLIARAQSHLEGVDLGGRTWSEVLGLLEKKVLELTEENGIPMHPQAKAWMTDRLGELGNTLDRIDSGAQTKDQRLVSRTVEEFLRRHREDLLDLTLLLPQKTKKAWQSLTVEGDLGEAARAIRVTRDDLQVLIPQGVQLLEKLGPDDTGFLVDLVNLFCDPSLEPEEKRMALSSMSERLGDFTRAMLSALDEKKSPDFFAELFERAGNMIDGRRRDKPPCAETAGKIGAVLDRLTRQLKQPEQSARLEAHLDVVRFFFRIEIDRLVRMNVFDAKETRAALDEVLQDATQLTDVLVNLIRAFASAARADKDGPDAALAALDVKECVENMGPFFTKLVQTFIDPIDAGRAQGDDNPIVDALKKLQDATRPVPFEDVQEIVARDLGKPIDEAFVRFDRTPFACASMAQCHLAEIERDGRRIQVVVKVLKPGAAEAIKHNFNLIRFLIKMLGSMAQELQHAEELGDEDLMEVTKKFDELREKHAALKDSSLSDIFAFLDAFAVNLEKSFVDEGDLRDELENNRRLAEILRFNDLLRVPDVYRDVSNREVMTMEFVPTLAISDLMEQDPESAKLQSDLKTRLISTFAAQSVIYRFLHGDFHGKNVGIDEDGRFVLYDVGQMVDLKGRLFPPLKLLLGAFFKSPGMVANAIVELSDHVDPKRPKMDGLLSMFRKAPPSSGGTPKAGKSTKKELTAALRQDLERSFEASYDETLLRRRREVIGGFGFDTRRAGELLRYNVLETSHSDAGPVADRAIQAIQAAWETLDDDAVRRLTGKRLLSAAREALEEHFSQEAEAEALAALCDLSPQEVAKRFATALGPMISEMSKKAGLGRIRRLDTLSRKTTVAEAAKNLDEAPADPSELIGGLIEDHFGGYGRPAEISERVTTAMRAVKDELRRLPQDAPLDAVVDKLETTLRAELERGDFEQAIERARMDELLPVVVSSMHRTLPECTKTDLEARLSAWLEDPKMRAELVSFGEGHLSDALKAAFEDLIDEDRSKLDALASDEGLKKRLAELASPLEVDTAAAAAAWMAQLLPHLDQEAAPPPILRRIIRGAVGPIGSLTKDAWAELTDRFRRMSLESMIRAETGAISLGGVLSRAAGRHDLSLSSQYFQLGKTLLSFQANVSRMRHPDADLQWREILAELLIREPLRFLAYKTKVPGLVADAANTGARTARAIGNTMTMKRAVPEPLEE